MADISAFRGGPKRRKTKKPAKSSLPGQGLNPPVGQKRTSGPSSTPKTTTGRKNAFGARRNENAKAYGVKGGRPSRSGGDPIPKPSPITKRQTLPASASPRAARMAVKVDVPTTAKIAPPMRGRDGGAPATTTPLPMSAKKRPIGGKKTTANPKLSNGVMKAPSRQRL